LIFSLEVQSRTGRIVVAYRLGTLGSANSLLCGVKRCENDYQPFSLSFQIRTVEPKGSIGSNPRPTPPKEKIEDTTRVSGGFGRVFAVGEYMHACRLQASLTRSARHM
jgi:hypothetical protein